MNKNGQIRHKWSRAAVLCLSAAAITPVLAQVENNPGYDRPGLGFTPAVLQPSDFIWEQGLPDWSRSSGVSQYDADTLLRLGIGRALELQLGSGWSWLDGSASSVDGRSNTSLGVKFAPSAAGDFSWGVLGSVELKDGARAFRNEQHQYLLGASFNWQHSEDHASGLYIEAVDGDADSQLLALNNEWTLTPALGLYVEWAMQHVASAGSGTVGGAGMTWQVTPRAQLDISARHRISGHTDTWQAGIGFAVYFGD